MSSLTERHQAWLGALISEDSTQAARELGSRTEAEEMLEWAMAKLSAADRMVVNLVISRVFRLRKPRIYWDGARPTLKFAPFAPAENSKTF